MAVLPASPSVRRTDPFYTSKAWREVRARILRRDKMCVECSEARSTHVDHIRAKRLFPELALVQSNLRGLCTSCHNTRSAQQYVPSAGGFDVNGEPLDPTHPWHAGEKARVRFRGAERAPRPEQLQVLRDAEAAGLPEDEAGLISFGYAAGSSSSDACVAASVPPPHRKP